ncbi:hypothetical protein HER10_EVM0001643 [Colletotrichum scovillei]|uniref:Uncharacterized protein n=1 Tax=Colletotrichum scovillei TaxID=1209932 RepID=A0A9P7RGD1_9PEZI|nr:uncharacterized protein HER10_EVM0001643 [Colletotrichum scovillei]KAF4779187.1 hypothetical protein HER10_EVM0001643 [Colletotrichum scovillei]KAG7057619.1 hypothetical protein JMJ77_0005002 [Colletotrichum scovillei]KAG7076216.1 hypothetical protein JMJ76_0013482 [Colletotrichum scovillei]KAG7083325.1 hypothetical protein JMJ78_0008771 [Colletotrichum scovillei]
MNSDKRPNESKAQSDMASRVNSDDVQVVETENGFHIESKDANKAYDALQKYWKARNLDESQRRITIFLSVEEPDAEEGGTSTEQPGDTAQGSDSDKAGANMKREED